LGDGERIATHPDEITGELGADIKSGSRSPGKTKAIRLRPRLPLRAQQFDEGGKP